MVDCIQCLSKKTKRGSFERVDFHINSIPIRIMKSYFIRWVINFVTNIKIMCQLFNSTILVNRIVIGKAPECDK